MLREDIRTYLVGLAPVAALIGDRLFYDHLPQECAVPAACFSMIAGDENHIVPVRFPRFQFSVYAATAAQAEAGCQAIKGGLKRFKGTMGSSTVLQGVVEGEGDLPYEPDTRRYGHYVDIKILYRGD